MELGKKLKEKLDEIGDKIKDLASLEVTTLSGDISLIPRSETGTFDLEKVVEQISQQDAALQGKIYVVATTLMKADQDTIQFVKQDLKPEEQALVKAHNESVKSALEARTAFLNFVKEFI